MKQDEINKPLEEKLIGKEFRYDSPTTGVSDWVDVVKSVFVITDLQLDLPKPKWYGHKLEIMIRGEKNRFLYKLEDVIFLNEENHEV